MEWDGSIPVPGNSEIYAAVDMLRKMGLDAFSGK